MSENKNMIAPEQGVSAGTIARTVCLILALVNQVLVMFDMVPIDLAEDTVYEGVSIVFTVVTALVAWWKNNSFTTKAIEADKVLKQ